MKKGIGSFVGDPKGGIKVEEGAEMEFVRDTRILSVYKGLVPLKDHGFLWMKTIFGGEI